MHSILTENAVKHFKYLFHFKFSSRMIFFTKNDINFETVITFQFLYFEIRVFD